jgi:hypothetical protein
MEFLLSPVYENARIFQKKWKSKLPYSIGRQQISIIDEINNASNLFYTTYRWRIKDSINHFIKINGLFYFSIFCVLTTAKIIAKLVHFCLAQRK